MIKNKGDMPVKSISKAISWRVIATLTTFFLVWIFTGNLIISLGIGIAELFLKIFFFYVHERIWNKIKWGEYNG